MSMLLRILLMPAGGQKNEHIQDISTVKTHTRKKFFIDKHFWQQKTYVCDSQKNKNYTDNEIHIMT